MSRYEFLLEGVREDAPVVIGAVGVSEAASMCPSVMVRALGDSALTVALEGSADGGDWTVVRKWDVFTPGWASFEAVPCGPEDLRAVAWTKEGKTAVGFFELSETKSAR